MVAVVEPPSGRIDSALDASRKRDYHVRNLPTRSVTLFPTRAQVVRDVKNVPLKPGTNQIAIVGLTPTVDEHSIKVEGTGSATVTDFSVELLPNRDIFEDIYPDSDSNETESEEEDHNSYDEEDSDELKTVKKKLQDLRDEQKRAKEVVASADARLKFLEAFGQTLTLEGKETIDLAAGLEAYSKQRELVFQDHMHGLTKGRDLDEQIRVVAKRQERLAQLQEKQSRKHQQAKREAKHREDKKKQRRAKEKLKEKLRILKSREDFWPRRCYVVRITLETIDFTPSSSRETSISSDVVEAAHEKGTHADGGSVSPEATCSLSLTYATSSAFWSPSYDLALSTTANTGNLCFDARLTNTTSETWSNCQVVLSTSQATFSGLNDTVPVLQPWRIKLAGKVSSGFGSATPRAANDVLESREEQNHKANHRHQQNAIPADFNRDRLFGVVSKGNPSYGVFGPQDNVHRQFASNAAAQHWGTGQAPAAQPQSQSLFGRSNNAGSGSLFGNPNNANTANPPPPPSGLFRHIAASTNNNAGTTRGGLFATGPQATTGTNAQNSGGGGLFGAPANPNTPGASVFGSGGAPQNTTMPPTLSTASRANSALVGVEPDSVDEGGSQQLPFPANPPLVPSLDFQESAFEETGMTTTYELPGLKTLVPGWTPSKQRVARIAFAKVIFSHTVVAKYKPAAYLKAHLRNGSKITLLRGPAGLTLDGCFLGRTTMPRCSAGDSFAMPLGVDPAITVAYPAPAVHRSTTGLFNKESNGVYKRTVALENTRGASVAERPVSITVLDQVPVSEDERLRVDVLHPRGLESGTTVPCASVGEGKEEKEKGWGSAKAMLKKEGEVRWDVSLNAGKAVKLVLEYEVGLPSGENAVQC